MATFNKGDKVRVSHSDALNNERDYDAEIIEGLGGDPPKAYRVHMGWLIAVVPAEKVRHVG